MFYFKLSFEYNMRLKINIIFAMLNRYCMKLYLSALILLVSIITGCSKSKTPGPTDNGSNNKPKIEIVSGNNQTAKVGFFLADTIKVKITGTGINVKNYTIEFRGSGCNADLPSIRAFPDNETTITNYRLAGNTGAQTLQATLIESGSNKRVDSVTFNFTGTEMTPGRNYSACTPFIDVANFCKIASGRIYATFGRENSVRYSDDNGISWFPVKSLGSNHYFVSIKSDGKNQIMLFAYNEGIYYSADGGATWELHGNAPFKGQQFLDMNYSVQGTMFFSTKEQNLYYSEDNGLNWTKISPPRGNGYKPSQGGNGDFFVFVQDDGLYRSADKGATWKRIADVPGSIGNDGMFAFYLDNNTGWLYKSVQSPRNDIYVSKDNGNTFSSLMLPGNLLSNYITVENGAVYFNTGGTVYKIDKDMHLSKITDIDMFQNGDYFIIANNNNFIASTEPYFVTVIR
jgi:photosystem II stability/assembly factor-like uncharacterized protein